MSHAVLLHHDLLPYVNENNEVLDPHVFERTEQLQAARYVLPQSCVLELGARYGLVSNILSSTLTHPTHHVAVEPDPTVLAALKRNKSAHGGQFRICTSVISTKPAHRLIHDSWGTRTVAAAAAPAAASVPSLSLAALEAREGIKFDCLVADCEGFLDQFFTEHPGTLLAFHTVIFEQDQVDKCNYANVHGSLTTAGFVCLVEGVHCVYMRDKNVRINTALSGVGHGRMGLLGFLGYDAGSAFKVTLPQQLGSCTGTISAHAPSHLFVTFEQPVVLSGFLNATSPSECAHEFLVNDELIGMCTAKRRCTSPVSLQAGVYRLVIRTSVVCNAHTVWAYRVRAGH